jgi:hypothetical protein
MNLKPISEYDVSSILLWKETHNYPREVKLLALSESMQLAKVQYGILLGYTTLWVATQNLERIAKQQNQ